MRKCLGVFLLLFTVNVVHGEAEFRGNKFVAVVVKGTVLYREAGSAVKPLRLLQPILPNSEVEIGEGGYLKVGEDGECVEITTKGTVKFDDIKSTFEQLRTVPRRNLKSIWDYLWGRVVSQAQATMGQDKERLVRGAVRTVEAATQIPLAPRNGKVLGDTILFAWYNGAYDGLQRVVIRDRDYDTVFQTDIAGSTLNVSASALRLQAGSSYTWSVARPGLTSQDVPFKLADRRSSDEVRREIQQGSTPDPGEATLASVVNALMFEKYQCYGNAYHEYVAALKGEQSEFTEGLFRSFLVEKLGLAPIEAETVLTSQK